MSRKPREKSSSGIYHIVLRGVNRQSIFEDDEDRLKLLEVLAKCKNISQCRLFAYCLMDNHVHILLQEVQEPISTIIQRVSSSYVIWFNSRHDRCGHLFQERFSSEAVETDSYFLTVLRYIHQNPAKAKLVANAADYNWSSYREYTEKGKIVDIHYALALFAGNSDEAVRRFARFSRETNTDVCLEIQENKIKISDEDLRQIVRQQFGIEAIQVSHEIREKQENILRVMKAVDGASIRQIARIAGLPAARVWKA
ncbi:transposase [Sporomusa aerivorans]|uniref:REP-associated tyrosine transposase n=1 Tax=Sporomusa aerivorans TaxID=204936 RepID=UPI00352A2161